MLANMTEEQQNDYRIRIACAIAASTDYLPMEARMDVWAGHVVAATDALMHALDPSWRSEAIARVEGGE